MFKTCAPPNHVEITNAAFSVFSQEDINDISVLQIVTPLTLDGLGHPVPGGLYDYRLGPSTDKGQPCGTCNKNGFQCFGHFGFIDLPVRCVNPIFHKVIGTIHKYSCLSCHRLQLTKETRKKIRQLTKQSDEEIVKMTVVTLILEEVKSRPKNFILCFN